MEKLFPALLFVLAISAIASGCAGKMRVASALMGNWALLSIIYSFTDDQFMWPINASVDYACGIFVLLYPVSRWQILVSGLYALALVAHAAFAFTGDTEATRYTYWFAMSYIAWAQAAVLGSWLIHDAARHRFSHLCPPRWRGWLASPLRRRVEEVSGEGRCS